MLLAILIALPLGLPAAAPQAGPRALDLTESGDSLSFRQLSPGVLAVDWSGDAAGGPAADPPAMELHGEPGSTLELRFSAVLAGYSARAWAGPGEWRALPASADPAGGLTVQLDFRSGREVVELLPPGAPAPRATAYSFGQLSNYLTGLPADPRVQITVLGTSVQGREIVKVVFDDRSAPMPAAWKPTVVALIRQHGNEWCSSYVFEGMLDYLMGRSGWTPDPKVTEQVRYVFYPMVNPDGTEANQRYNAHGIDLNRNWSGSGPAAWQEPEVFLIQSDLASLPFQDTIRVGGDHHGWWSGIDGGYRYNDGGAPASVSHAAYLEGVKDTVRYTQYEPGVYAWYENGGQSGMSRVELNHWKGWLLHTPEYDTPSWRDENRLREIGTRWTQAMRDTVYAAEITVGSISLGAGTPVTLRVDEDDQNLLPGTVETVELYLADWAGGDRERAVLTETGPNTGVFVLQPGFPISGGPRTRWDGVLQTSAGSWVIAYYADPDLPVDHCYAGVPVLP